MYIEVTQTISNIIEKQVSKTIIEVKPFDTGVGKIAESILQSAGDLIVKYKSGAIGRLPRGANGLFIRVNTALEEQYEFAQLIGLSAFTLTNKDTVAANQGDLVILNTAAPSSFVKTTTEGQAGVIGVISDTTVLIDVIGTIQFAGTALVNVTGNVAIGDYLIPSSTKGLAKSIGVANAKGTIGRAVTSYLGGATGQVTALLNLNRGQLYRQLWMSGWESTGSVMRDKLVTAMGRVYPFLPFDPNTTQYAFQNAPLPDDYSGGDIYAKFYWFHPSTVTNFGVRFGLAGVAIGDGGDLNVNTGTPVEVDDTGGVTDYLYITTQTAAITIAGTPTPGKNVHFVAYRNASAASDTLAVNARLFGVMTWYPVG